MLALLEIQAPLINEHKQNKVPLKEQWMATLQGCK